MEVHDTGGRLQAVLELLRGVGGFQMVAAEQPGSLAGSNLWHVYASKSAPQQRVDMPRE